MARPTTPTTPEQLSVIVWTFILLLLVLGAIGMWYSLRAPAEKADQASQLFWISLASWSLAAGIYGGKRLWGLFFD